MNRYTAPNSFYAIVQLASSRVDISALRQKSMCLARAELGIRDVANELGVKESTSYSIVKDTELGCLDAPPGRAREAIVDSGYDC
jgi:transposase-like protein